MLLVPHVDDAVARPASNSAAAPAPPAASVQRSDAVSPDTPSQLKRKAELQEENSRAIARIVSSHKDSLYSNPDDERCLICVRLDITHFLC